DHVPRRTLSRSVCMATQPKGATEIMQHGTDHNDIAMAYRSVAEGKGEAGEPQATPSPLSQ
ncbi:MAG: hypothetical protein KAV82_05560, partial [Phycisphaerae bacterium]|nr:hypothetical protein [Phycisphaerae bacterium]